MKIILMTLGMLLSSLVLAGPGQGHSHGGGHSHKTKEIEEVKTIEVGKSHIKRLVKEKKLNASWEEAEHLSSEKKKFGTRNEWVVIFENDKAEKDKKLYIFLKLSGDFVAANFTGK